MKVKRNYFVLGVFLSVLVVVITIGGLLLFIQWRYDFSLSKSLVDIPDKLELDQVSAIDVLKYDIDISMDSSKQSIEGNVSITFVCLDEIDNVKFDFYNDFEIDSIKLNNREVGYIFEDNKLILEYNFIINDTLVASISYSGKPESLGLGSFNFGTYRDKSFIYTLNEPVFAPTWFPCNDILTDKAKLKMSITNDSSKTSVSNGRLVDIKTLGEKRKFIYETEYPIATYLIALYSAEYFQLKDFYTSSESGNTMQLRYYVTEDKIQAAEKDFSIHPEAIGILSGIFGQYPFPLDGYGVAEFLWQMGAMEHQTITGVGSDFISGHKFHTGMLVHELAHHWWGNAVTPKSWKDIWLNEGFATYSEALYFEKKSGFKALQSTMAAYTGSFEQGTLYNPGINMFSRLVYNKGAWVLHMLRYKLGDRIFFEVLRNYFEKYKYKNAGTDDFIDVCEELSDGNLKRFFNQWVYEGVGIPEVEYQWDYSNNSVSLKLNQVQDQEIVYEFLLETNMITENDTVKNMFNVYSKDTLLTIPLGVKPVEVQIDPDNWLLVSFNEKVKK